MNVEGEVEGKRGKRKSFKKTLHHVLSLFTLQPKPAGWLLAWVLFFSPFAVHVLLLNVDYNNLNPVQLVFHYIIIITITTTALYKWLWHVYSRK